MGNILNIRSLIKSCFTVLCIFLLNAPSFSEPPNIALLKEEVKTYHDSGAYEKEITATLKKAHDFMMNRVNANAKLKHPQNLAVVLDIDETSLSNYPSLVKYQFTFSRKRAHETNLQANAAVIKPMRDFFEQARKNGVSVFFVTGRVESERHATEKNLKRAGYHGWTALYLKPNDYKNSSAIEYKTNMRAKITQEGYTIIASIGDQVSDLIGGYAEQTYKLPNPYYYLP